MKVSEIAEQLAKNPNTVFHMKGGRRWGDDTKGRIIEVTSEQYGKYSWKQETRVCYKVEVLARDYGNGDEFAYTVKSVSETVLPQHIYGVWSDTQTLEEECVRYGESSRKSAERKAKNTERTNMLTDFIVEQARAHHEGYLSVYEWKLKETGLPFLEALAKALGLNEPQPDLDTGVSNDDTVLVGGKQ